LKLFKAFCYNLAMVIDFHTHVLPPHIKKNRSQYIDSDPCFAILYSKKDAKIATADELIDSMDKDGVDISVILNYGWLTHELCVETNDYILESIARYPKRLIGFGAVPPNPGQAARAEIERCARGGIKGVGELRPDMCFPDFARKESMEPLVAVLRQHRLILLTHASEPVGHIYAGKGHATPAMLYSFITNFPDLPVVCAHWGGGLPFYALMPEVKKALQNVYFDTAASPFLYRPQIYDHVSQLVGADRILFGSDYPLLPPGRFLQEINATDLSKEARSLILSGNARRLLGI
jgi:predicted TIM-barrel fold metal-dependent hydrolase